MKKFRRRLIESRRGTSLVEMIVAMLIFGIVTTMMVGVLSPAAKLFLRMERLQRAQIILDNTIQELYAMTETATGYIKIYSDTEPVGAVGADSGPILEFLEQENYAVLVSTGGCGPTKIVVGDVEKGSSEEVKPGRLLARYYYAKKITGNDYSYNYQYADSSNNLMARAVARIFTDGYYMGNYLEIEFSFPSEANASGDSVPYVNADVKLYGTDSDGNKAQLIVQEKVVLNFRYAVVRNDEVTATDVLSGP